MTPENDYRIRYVHDILAARLDHAVKFLNDAKANAARPMILHLSRHMDQLILDKRKLRDLVDRIRSANSGLVTDIDAALQLVKCRQAELNDAVEMFDSLIESLTTSNRHAKNKSPEA